MTKEAPEPKIRVGLAGDYACLIFDPPRTEAECQLVSAEKIFPPPLAIKTMSAKKRDNEIFLWWKATFNGGRLEPLKYLDRELSELAALYPARTFKPKHRELGEAAISLFQAWDVRQQKVNPPVED